MASRHDARTWDSFLPPAYNWLDSLKIETIAEPASDSWLIVPVVYDKGLDLSKSSLSSELSSKVEAEARRIGWQGKGLQTLAVDDKYVVLAPLSKLDVSWDRRAREAGLEVSRHLKDAKINHVTFCGSAEMAVAKLLEGYLDGLYEIGLFKGASHSREFPSDVSVLGAVTDKDLDFVVSMVRGTLFTRMLQDAPANWLNSERWGEIASAVFEGRSGVTVKVLGREQLKAEKMGSFLSVAAGSPVDPKLISIKIKGKSSQKTVALVGKGLTFDAGGISLKGSAGMGEMKYDMSGGAAVMGAAHFLSECQPEHDVHCLIGAVENMPSGTATRPGDIVQARNGKTIEVLNTDAEGRLVLADVLDFAADEKPDFIVNLATLTGAVLHGLGHSGAAIMSNNPSSAALMLAVGEDSGEPLWQMPIWPELAKEVKSDIADLKNIAKPSVLAGTIVAGAFLREFVPKDIPWVHMDIAGTAWTCSATGYPKAGGSGFGVRSIAQLCSADL